MSVRLILGKREPYRLPVRGSIDAALVEPKLDPSMLEHTTKLRSVSTGAPGPTSVVQEPSDEPPSGSIIWWPLV